MLVVRVLLVCACAMAPCVAQNVHAGGCYNYQGDRSFDVNFIHSLTDHVDGFYFALTTAEPQTCQRITFLPGGTFLYSYIDQSQDAHNYTGPYSATPATFTSPGYIVLDDLPVGQLGADLLGDVRLRVVISDSERIVVISCVPLGVISVERASALVPASKFRGNTAIQLNKHLIGIKFPNMDSFSEISQTCIQNLRGVTPILNQFRKIYRFFAKLGIVPNKPFSENTIEGTSPLDIEQTPLDIEQTLQAGIGDINISPAALQVLTDALAAALVAESVPTRSTASLSSAPIGSVSSLSSAPIGSVSSLSYVPIRSVSSLSSLPIRSVSSLSSAPIRSVASLSAPFRSVAPLSSTPIRSVPSLSSAPLSSNSLSTNSLFRSALPTTSFQSPLVYAAAPTTNQEVVNYVPQGYIQSGSPGNQIYSRFYVK